MFHGLRGRIIAGFFATTGGLSLAITTAQEIGLFKLIPQKFLWVSTGLPLAALFFNTFAERVQGGASKPEVRHKAREAEAKKSAEKWS